MSNQPDQRVSKWVTNIQAHAREENNDLLLDVAENLTYLKDHVEEWESGELEYTDLPNFDAEIRWLIKQSVLFGTQFAADRAELYLVTAEDGRFVGLFGTEENADERASDSPGLKVQQAEPEVRDPTKILEPMWDSPGAGPNAIADNLGYILEHDEEFMDGEVTGDDLPELDEDARHLTILAVLFGILWEYSYPGLRGVFEGDQLRELHRSASKADDRAEALGEDHYAQRVAIVDGDIGPDELLPEIEEVA